MILNATSSEQNFDETPKNDDIQKMSLLQNNYHSKHDSLGMIVRKMISTSFFPTL